MSSSEGVLRQEWSAQFCPSVACGGFIATSELFILGLQAAVSSCTVLQATAFGWVCPAPLANGRHAMLLLWQAKWDNSHIVQMGDRLAVMHWFTQDLNGVPSRLVDICTSRLPLRQV